MGPYFVPSRSSVLSSDFGASMPSGGSLFRPEPGLLSGICTSTLAKLTYSSQPSFFLSLKTLCLIDFGKLSRLLVLALEMFQK